MKKYSKPIECDTRSRSRMKDDLDIAIADLQDKLDLIATGPDLFNDSSLEVLLQVIEKFNKELGLDLKLIDDGFAIQSATEPDATYQNKRNPNKFIETKKYKDGHTVARQYMKWDTPNGEVKNYTGAKDAKRGRYFRTDKATLHDMLDDYDEIESTSQVFIFDGWDEPEMEFSGAGEDWQFYFLNGDHVGSVSHWSDDGDFGYEAYLVNGGGAANREWIGDFKSREEAQKAVEDALRS